MSTGEELIAKILTKAKIPFEREKTFYDLKKGRYRYDFYIENLDGRHVVIEFNGPQHYELVKKFYETERLWRAALERDRAKISYCLANNIDIYIIPYWDQIKLRQRADLFKPEYKAKTRWHTDEIRLNRLAKK
jgi:hypothetical protein